MSRHVVLRHSLGDEADQDRPRRRTVALRRAGRGDAALAGGAEGRRCASTAAGAAYATSEITVTPDRLVSWDRGLDDDGVQIWGAEQGCYVFIRVR
jgi:hypothetical protein